MCNPWKLINCAKPWIESSYLLYILTGLVCPEMVWFALGFDDSILRYLLVCVRVGACMHACMFVCVCVWHLLLLLSFSTWLCIMVVIIFFVFVLDICDHVHVFNLCHCVYWCITLFVKRIESIITGVSANTNNGNYYYYYYFICWMVAF